MLGEDPPGATPQQGRGPAGRGPHNTSQSAVSWRKSEPQTERSG